MLRTKRDFIRLLDALEIKDTDTLLVHDWADPHAFVGGGAMAMSILADRLKANGTLCVCDHLAANQDPTKWDHRFSQLDTLRQDLSQIDMEHFEKAMVHPTYRALLACGITFANNHPTAKFLAYGKYAKYLNRFNSLDFPYGLESPFAILYELDGLVLTSGLENPFWEVRHGYAYSKKAPVEVCGANQANQWVSYLDYRPDAAYLADVVSRVKPLRSVGVDQITYSIYSYRDLIDPFKRGAD